MFAWQATVQDERGNAIPEPVVAVYESDGSTLAVIYNESGDALNNPLTGTPEGFVQFWAEAGEYKIVGANGGDVTQEWSVFLDTPLIEAVTRAEDAADAAAEDRVQTGEDREATEIARDETVNAAPFAVNDAAAFFAKTELVEGARYYAKDGSGVWDVLPFGALGHLTVAGKPVNVVGSVWGYNVKAFGAVGADGVDDSEAFTKAVAVADGATLFVPEGVYRVSNVTGTKATFVGLGAEKSVIELATYGTELVFDIDELRLEGLTVSDRGRASMDHTGNAGTFLFECVDKFSAKDCEFLTDRCVLYQVPSTLDSYGIVENCSVARVNAPIPGEEDAMNIFICNAAFVHFDALNCESLVARSVINATQVQATAGTMNPVVACVENCRFDYVHNSGTGNEVKTIFVQGYTSTIRNNTFTDCFGRHIDVLGNLSSSSAQGVFQPSVIEGNKVGYTTARQSATGHDNNEAGSIYCRYSEATIIGNIQDFTNLILTSNTYNGISARHGYKQVLIQGNTVILAKAHAIETDISDSITTDKCAVSIIGNTVSSVNSARLPISVANNSATKVFSHVTIRDNTITYTHRTEGIILDIAQARGTSFCFDHVTIENNWNTSFSSIDAVDFQAFPAYLHAPNTLVTITVNPAGTNAAGIIASLSDAVGAIARYNCKRLTIQLAAGVTTTQTITGPYTRTVLPKSLVIDGDNGASGRIRFYTAGTQQTNLGLTLDGNEVTFDGCIFNSDSVASTTALLFLSGHGKVLLKDCDAQYGEYYVDTRGPDVSIKGGTINNINLGSGSALAVVFCNSDRLVNISLSGASGSNNTRLYNLATPAVLIHDGLSIGTTAGTKTFTVVT